MRDYLFIAAALIFSARTVNSQIIVKAPLSPRITGYRIDARLDVSSKTVNGTMEAFWVNKTNDIVPDIFLHLYMNAFRSERTTFNREAGWKPGNDSSLFGRIDLKYFTLRDGKDIKSRIKYIQPDDNNPHDSTVIQILLPEPAKPGDTVFINAGFVTRLPSRIVRTGYSDDFFFVGQWFPKFGVYEHAGMRYSTKGGWNCHQFHERSEFYADHSVYDVRITVPKEYVVGTGGMLMSEAGNDTKTKTQTWRAEDIVDFAWTAWPGFAVYTDQWKHVKITLLIPKTRTEQVQRQFTAVKNALEYFEKNVGPYPWPHVTIVDPPAKGSGASGMEYTTLFTSESVYKLPSWFHILEMTTVHEFGHAYFMGILASNEFEEPWLDEGVNSFWEERIIDHYWGENSGIIDLPMIKIPDKSESRIGYVHSQSRQVASNKEFSWNYPHESYGMLSYEKTATWLYTLMGIIGEDAMNEVFRQYYREWAFKHPCGKDFVNVVNEVVKRIYGDKFGTDMNWFFDETLYGTGICDYKVEGFTNTKGKTSSSNKGKADKSVSMAVADSSQKAVVRLERDGEVMLPVEVAVHFSDGNEIIENWDGKSRFRDYTYYGKKVLWVRIDPEFKNRMDINFINNSMTDEPNRIPERRFSDKLIAFLQLLTSILTL